eukprot:TRINITY_DN93175_c0_g1_i1.p2 TRINITY_DN93175_c0_g1~~TRINITY_DN93175_c0_g1_i1.p2  ORF type:complete len:201 (+),score=42.79 TRINITY_DN93175_c0_g1_i1:77-604(+)
MLSRAAVRATLLPAAFGPGIGLVNCGSAAAPAVAARSKKILAKQTHHRHNPNSRHRQQRDSAGTVLVSPNAIPRYDLSKLPEEFERLRRDKKSEVLKWAATIAHAIGDRCVTYPSKIEAKDHFRIDYKGMCFFLRSPPNNQELSNPQKKTLLNVLAHMATRIFGEVAPKLVSEEE